MFDKMALKLLSVDHFSSGNLQSTGIRGENYMSLAIVTDSTAYLSDEFVSRHDITVLPLTITFSDGSYRDNIDITIDEFYAKMAALDEIPTSSQPAPGLVTEAFEGLAETHDEILVVTLSKGISGTFQTFSMIASEVAEEKNVRIEVYNSDISLIGQGLFVQEAVKLREQGLGLMDILPKLDALKLTADAYFSVEDLGHLAKGGRISASAAGIGNLLQVKPILHFEQGKIEVFEKVRTHKKTVKRMLDLFEQAYQANPHLRVAIVGEDDTSQVQSLVTYMTENHPDIDMQRTPVGPVIGTHLGPAAYALVWWQNTDID